MRYGLCGSRFTHKTPSKEQYYKYTEKQSEFKSDTKKHYIEFKNLTNFSTDYKHKLTKINVLQIF